MSVPQARGPHEREVGLNHRENTSSAVSSREVGLWGLELRTVLSRHGTRRAESLPFFTPQPHRGPQWPSWVSTSEIGPCHVPPVPVEAAVGGEEGWKAGMS